MSATLPTPQTIAASVLLTNLTNLTNLVQPLSATTSPTPSWSTARRGYRWPSRVRVEGRRDEFSYTTDSPGGARAPTGRTIDAGAGTRIVEYHVQQTVFGISHRRDGGTGRHHGNRRAARGWAARRRPGRSGCAPSRARCRATGAQANCVASPHLSALAMSFRPTSSAGRWVASRILRDRSPTMLVTATGACRTAVVVIVRRSYHAWPVDSC